MLPISVLILIGLFMVQNRGSGRLGRVFGPILLIWFIVLGVLAILGLLPTVKSPVEQVVLLPGDMLIFSTDGVTERRHRGTLFGIDRLRAEASTLAGFPAEVVAARLRTAAVAFSPEPPRDDIAVLTVRIEP